MIRLYQPCHHQTGTMSWFLHTQKMNKARTLVGSAPSRVRHFRSSRNLLLTVSRTYSPWCLPAPTHSHIPYPYFRQIIGSVGNKQWRMKTFWGVHFYNFRRIPDTMVFKCLGEDGDATKPRNSSAIHGLGWSEQITGTPKILHPQFCLIPLYILLLIPALEYTNTHTHTRIYMYIYIYSYIIYICILLCILFIWCPFFIWFLIRGGKKADPCDMYRHHRADDAEEHVSGANGQLARGQRNCRSRLDSSG